MPGQVPLKPRLKPGHPGINSSTSIPRHSVAWDCESGKSTKHLTNREPGFRDQQKYTRFCQQDSAHEQQLFFDLIHALLHNSESPPNLGCLNKHRGARSQLKLASHLIYPMSSSPPDSETITASNAPLAKKACHSCRRARLRCDKSFPHCTKCVSRGVECLGYGRLFLWTGSVATRGKLAGQSSSASVCRLPKQGEAEVTEVSPDMQTDSLDTPTFESGAWGLASPQENQLVLQDKSQPWSPPSPPSPTSSGSPWTLVDPLFQDMTHSQRWYLNYCMTSLETSVL